LPPDSQQIETDVRALDQLGWFEWVHAEVEPLSIQPAEEQSRSERLQLPMLRLVFRVQERPLLAAISFRGSRVLSRQQISALLAQDGIAFKIAAPVDRVKLQSSVRLIEVELADRGFPDARVLVYLNSVPTAAVKAVFEIDDGPQVRLAKVSFGGDAIFPQEVLRRQMKRVAPHAMFSRLRDKNVYTPGRLEEDLRYLADFYRDRGYPEVRIGIPAVRVEATARRRWWSWPRRAGAGSFHIFIPIAAGEHYSLESVEVRNDLPGATLRQTEAVTAALRQLKHGEGFSQQKIEETREALRMLRALRPAKKNALPPEIEVERQFDRARRLARLTFHIREARPYTVRRIEFSGHRRFSDRYYRRRVRLKEGDPFNPVTLELGLAQLATTGFIRPLRPQNVHIRFNEERRTADVAIRIEEIGRQRFSLTGGQAAATGNTLGMAYNVFDFLGGEELLTGYLEGGPESLQIAVS
ncbi:MAG: POTRA domain-containing protein, partial [Burkholderiales bacterium]